MPACGMESIGIMEIPNMFYTLLVISAIALGFYEFMFYVTDAYPAYFPVDNISKFNMQEPLKEKANITLTGVGGDVFTTIFSGSLLTEAVEGITKMLQSLTDIVDLITSIFGMIGSLFTGSEKYIAFVGIAAMIWIGWQVLSWLRGYKT